MRIEHTWNGYCQQLSPRYRWKMSWMCEVQRDKTTTWSLGPNQHLPIIIVVCWFYSNLCAACGVREYQWFNYFWLWLIRDPQQFTGLGSSYGLAMIRQYKLTCKTGKRQLSSICVTSVKDNSLSTPSPRAFSATAAAVVVVTVVEGRKESKRPMDRTTTPSSNWIQRHVAVHQNHYRWRFVSLRSDAAGCGNLISKGHVVFINHEVVVLVATRRS